MKLINHGLKFVHTIPSARSDNIQQVRMWNEDPQAFLERAYAPTTIKHKARKVEWLLAPLAYYPRVIDFAFPYEAPHRYSIYF